MAITNFSELKTAIANWLDRSDLTAIIPDFITLTEDRMYRGEPLPGLGSPSLGGDDEVDGLRLRYMEQAATRDTVSGTERYGLPSDFLEMRNISYVRDSQTIDLVLRVPRQLDEHYREDHTAYPEAFAIEGTEIRIRPIPSGTWTLRQLYYKKLDALSDANSENDILTNYPSIYLFGSLAEAELYLKNDQRASLWDQRFLAAIRGANKDHARARRKGGALQAVSKVGKYRTRGI